MSLCRVAAALIAGDEEQLREEFHRALDSGLPVTALREVIFTAYLFDGYPTALEGFRVLASVAGPTVPPPKDVEYTANSISRWRNRGEKLCRTVYGPQYEKLTGHVAEIAPELADAMLVEGYGKVLSRDGLDPMVRELVVVTILAVKFRPRQLLSHCLGALRLGATESELLNAFAKAAIYSTHKIEELASAVRDDAMRRYVKS